MYGMYVLKWYKKNTQQTRTKRTEHVQNKGIE